MGWCGGVRGDRGNFRRWKYHTTLKVAIDRQGKATLFHSKGKTES